MRRRDSSSFGLARRTRCHFLPRPLQDLCFFHYLQDCINMFNDGSGQSSGKCNARRPRPFLRASSELRTAYRSSPAPRLPAQPSACVQPAPSQQVVRSKSSGLKLSPSQALPLGLPGGEQSSLAHIVTSRADSLALHCADTSRATGSVTGIRPIIFPSPPSGFYLHAAGSGPDESTASQAASSIPADQPSLVSINWDALQQEMLHALAIEDLAQRKDSIPSYVLQAAYNSDMLRATTAPSQMQRQQSGTPGAGIVVLPAGSPAVGTNSNVVPRGTDTQRRVTDEERSSLTSNMTSRPSFELTTFTDPDPPRHTYPPVKPSESHSADFAAYAHLTGIKALSSRTSNLQQPAARPAGPPVNLPGVEGKPARVSQGAPVMPAQPALSKRRAATVHDLAEPRGMAHASAHGLGASGMVVATPPGSPPVIAVRQTLIGRGCSSMSGPDEIPGAKQLSVVPLLQVWGGCTHMLCGQACTPSGRILGFVRMLCMQEM